MFPAVWQSSLSLCLLLIITHAHTGVYLQGKHSLYGEERVQTEEHVCIIISHHVWENESFHKTEWTLWSAINRAHILSMQSISISQHTALNTIGEQVLYIHFRAPYSSGLLRVIRDASLLLNFHNTWPFRSSGHGRPHPTMPSAHNGRPRSLQPFVISFQTAANLGLESRV